MQFKIDLSAFLDLGMLLRDNNTLKVSKLLADGGQCASRYYYNDTDVLRLSNISEPPNYPNNKSKIHQCYLKRGTFLVMLCIALPNSMNQFLFILIQISILILNFQFFFFIFLKKRNKCCCHHQRLFFFCLFRLKSVLKNIFVFVFSKNTKNLKPE